MRKTLRRFAVGFCSLFCFALCGSSLTFDDEGAASISKRSFVSVAVASDFNLNNVSMQNAPKWLTRARVSRVSGRIEKYLEWDIRRVSVRWIEDPNEFQKTHGFNSSVLAVTKPAQNTIFMGPKVNDGNFDGVFGHELAHVILNQKYRGAIPKWLEEGLANFAAKRGDIDYRWLEQQPPIDVTSLSHPFGDSKGSISSGAGPKYHYMASTALIEMIAKSCNIHDLLQLSMGAGLEKYLSTFCQIQDINQSFQKWIKKKASR